MIKAVITGDLIHSSRMNSTQKARLYDHIAKALLVWNKDFGMKSELYRGDSFQCMVNNVSDALRTALIIKTYIRSLLPDETYKTGAANEANTVFVFDARMAIGIGNTDHERARLATSDGEAFRLSGRELDEIKNTRRSISIATRDSYEEELKTESAMLDAILYKTTAFQCEVINLKLLGYTEIEIAKRIHIKQSAVNQRSNSAGWAAIETFVRRFETIYKK